MEGVIKRLLEVDKNARLKVEQAQAKKADVVREIESERERMKKSSEETFVLRSEQLRQRAFEEFEKEYSDDKVNQKRKKATDELEEVYSANRDRWVQEIFEKITKG